MCFLNLLLKIFQLVSKVSGLVLSQLLELFVEVGVLDRQILQLVQEGLLAFLELPNSPFCHSKDNQIVLI